jgi:purine-cytosine permease-like protein
MNKRTLIQLLCLTVAIATIWILPEISDTFNRIIMGWIAGWQIGGWAYRIGEWIYERTNK